MLTGKEIVSKNNIHLLLFWQDGWKEEGAVARRYC